MAKTEKTYIGTKIEILVRIGFDLDPGVGTDAVIAGHEVDVKWSDSLQWMIGPQLIGKICLGLGLTNGGRGFRVGVFRASLESLRAGRNQDRKTSLTAEALRTGVEWIVASATLPKDFIAELPDGLRAEIFAGGSAQERIRRLGELVQGVPIPRRAILTVARDKDDATRRLRQDNSKRGRGLGSIVFLSTKARGKLLRKLGYTALPRDHWIAVRKEDLHGLPG